MSLVELANQAQGLDGLKVIPRIDSDVSGLEPQEGGISFPVEALVAVPTISGTLSGITPQETSTPVPESPEKHIGDLAPLKEEPSYYTDVSSLSPEGNLVAIDGEPQITLDGKTPKNVVKGDFFTIISVDPESRMARVRDSEGNEGSMYLGDSSKDSHLVYTPKPEVEPGPTAIPVPTPIETPESEEVALAPAEPMTEDQPEDESDGLVDTELQAKLNQQLFIDGQQNIYQNPSDIDNPVVWLTTENGTTVQFDGREAQEIDGQIWVRINVLQDGEILTYQGIRLSGDWIPLATFSDSSINSLTVKNLKEAGFNVVEKNTISSGQEQAITELPKVENRKPVEPNYSFFAGEVYPIDFDMQKNAKFVWGIRGKVSDVVLDGDNKVVVEFSGPNYESGYSEIFSKGDGVHALTVKVRLNRDNLKVGRLIKHKTGERDGVQLYGDDRVDTLGNQDWTLGDLGTLKDSGAKSYLMIPLDSHTLGDVLRAMQRGASIAVDSPKNEVILAEPPLD